MSVVANAGPLVALGELGLLHLLQQLYGPVSIPSVVHEGVVTHGLETEQPDAYVAQLATARGELVVVDIDDATLSEAIQVLPLGKGEKQAIQLGLAH